VSDKYDEDSDTAPTTLEFFTVAETAAILDVSRRLVSKWIGCVSEIVHSLS